MLEFISDLLATKVAFYLMIAYNIGVLIYLGIDIFKDKGGKTNVNTKSYRRRISTNNEFKK